MNGLKAAKILRERHGSNVKIFLVTGNVLFEQASHKIFDGIVGKPCSRKELNTILHGEEV